MVFSWGMLVKSEGVNIMAAHEKFTVLMYNFFGKIKKIFYSKFIECNWQEFRN